jgi:[acyl-carrier-protein] S-malonyltransferase
MKKIFIFPGQGSQFIGMGKHIYNKYDIAKNTFDKVDELLKKNLTKIMFEGPTEELNLTENTQPALMAYSIALLRVILQLTNKNIEDLCSYTAGHSVGEYTALCAAESINLDTATRLLQRRGQFMQEACNGTDGAMAACLNISREALEKILADLSKLGVCNIANDNSDGQIVISGKRFIIERAVSIIKDIGGKAILLNVNGAFHSSLMEEAQSKMTNEIELAQFNSAKIPIVMNVSAEPTIDILEIKQNLSKQIVSQVRWREIMLFALNNELEVIEIGAGQVLSNLSRRSNYSFNIQSVHDETSLENFIAKL